MRIIKRKKSNRHYYYLQHSYRKGKKVITKELYLGKNLPKDIEQIKNKFFRSIKKNLFIRFDLIKSNFKKEWAKLPQSIKQKRLEEISIEFTYNTNAIEGSTISLPETREIIHNKIGPNKPLSDIKETEAHSKLFLNMVNENQPISKDLLNEWHSKLFSETKKDIAGKYRDYLIRVQDYKAPDWQDVDKLMDNLIQLANNPKGFHPIEHAAIVHYRFEKIHPFGDGNGRIGRLLMNYLLWNKGFPFLIIPYKKRKSYYNALKKSEQEFVNYFIRRYFSTFREYQT
jgi:Fic family protein